MFNNVFLFLFCTIMNVLWRYASELG